MINTWLKVRSSFYDAAILAAAGIAIMKLAQRWASRKGFESDCATAALLQQVFTDTGYLPMPPLHQLPGPGPPDHDCSMLSCGIKAWTSLRTAFQKLHAALVPWTPHLWEPAIRTSAALSRVLESDACYCKEGTLQKFQREAIIVLSRASQGACQEAWPQCDFCRKDLTAFEDLLRDYLPPSRSRLQAESRSRVDSEKLVALRQLSAVSVNSCKCLYRQRSNLHVGTCSETKSLKLFYF